jgi:hypothetical protein
VREYTTLGLVRERGWMRGPSADSLSDAEKTRLTAIKAGCAVTIVPGKEHSGPVNEGYYMRRLDTGDDAWLQSLLGHQFVQVNTEFSKFIEGWIAKKRLAAAGASSQS